MSYNLRKTRKFITKNNYQQACKTNKKRESQRMLFKFMTYLFVETKNIIE